MIVGILPVKMPKHLKDVTLVSDDEKIIVGILSVRMSMHLFDITLVNDELVGILPVRKMT